MVGTTQPKLNRDLVWQLVRGAFVFGFNYGLLSSSDFSPAQQYFVSSLKKKKRIPTLLLSPPSE